MEDFNSKYTGQQVEDLLDRVSSEGDGSEDTYIAPFTVEDVAWLHNGDIATLSIPIALIEAVISKKRVLIPSELDFGNGFAELVNAEGYIGEADAGLIAYFFIMREIYSIYIDDGISDGAIIVSKEHIGRAIVPTQDEIVGIASIEQTTTSNVDGGSNIITATLSNGIKSTFTIKNGSKGSQGIQGIQGPKGDKGDKGDTGAAGANGTNGVSVSSVKQTTTSTADGGTNVVTVTLSNGTTSTFSVKNGSKGSNGTNGTNGKDGADGATFTPSVDSAGNLSWTNNKGLTNPPTVNIKGPKGDSGSGEGGGESYAGNYPTYRHTSMTSSLAIQPNTFTIPKYTTTYIISLSPPSNNDIVNEYIFAWYSSPVGNSLSLPSSIVWANDDVLIPEDYTTYIISIIDNVAVYIKVEGNIYNVTLPAGGGDN